MQREPSVYLINTNLNMRVGIDYRTGPHWDGQARRVAIKFQRTGQRWIMEKTSNITNKFRLKTELKSKHGVGWYYLGAMPDFEYLKIYHEKDMKEQGYQSEFQYDKENKMLSIIDDDNLYNLFMYDNMLRRFLYDPNFRHTTIPFDKKGDGINKHGWILREA